MRKAAVATMFVVAAFGPHVLAGRPVVKTPELKLTVTQSPDPAPVGRETEVRVAVAPPEGITLNRYPGITLKVAQASGVSLKESEAFVGVREPLEDPADFPFKTIDPLKLQVTVTGGGAGQRTLEGDLTFFYCVKKSGYCAPGKTKITIPVKVAG